MLFRSTMVVKRATNALKRAARVSMKQAMLMAFMATMPPMWLTYTGMEENDVYNPMKWASARILISFGTMMFVVAMTYRQLPLDLIPNWIPFIGKADDLIAGLIAGVGLTITFIGWHFGMGPKPIEAVLVVNGFSYAWMALYPVRLGGLWLVKVIFQAAKPLKFVKGLVS